MSDAPPAWPRALAVPLDVAVVEEGGGWLLWRVRAAGNVDYGFARGERPDGCLAAFLALEEAPASDFTGFARRWGVLGISARSGRPGVVDGCAPRPAESSDDLFPRTSLTEGWTVPLRIYHEPLASWRELAATLAATLRAGEALRGGSPAGEADLRALFGEEAAATLSGTSRAVGEQRVRLGQLVGGWLEEAGLRPVFSWPFASGTPELGFDARMRGEGGDGNGDDAFAWPARSLYPELLTQIVEQLRRS